MMFRFAWLLPAAFWAAFLCAASAQHVHPDETITDPKVAEFYDSWMIAPQRTSSCCSRKDCYAAQVRKRGGHWEYLHKWSHTWMPLPDEKIEQNLTSVTPRETPDGQSHVCASESTGYVYCAVLGSGG